MRITGKIDLAQRLRMVSPGQFIPDLVFAVAERTVDRFYVYDEDPTVDLDSRLRSLEAQRRQMEEALKGARSFTSAVAGDDCPHAPWAERELRRVTAALAAPVPEEGGEPRPSSEGERSGR